MSRWSEPVGMLVVNCMSVSTGAKHAAHIFTTALELPGVDVVYGSECSDFRAAAILPRREWAIVQPGALDSAQSGVLVAFRKGRGRLVWDKKTTGSPFTREGGGIRERLIVTARLHLEEGPTFNVAAGHPPPGRAPKARARYARNFRHTQANFKGADFNMRRRQVARLFGRRVRGRGVLWLVLGRGCRIESSRTYDVGSDHLAVLVTVRIRMRGKR